MATTESPAISGDDSPKGMRVPATFLTIFTSVSGGLLLTALLGLWHAQTTITRLEEKVSNLEKEKISGPLLQQMLTDSRAEISELRDKSTTYLANIQATKTNTEVHIQQITELQNRDEKTAETIASMRERLAKLEAKASSP